ncbi:MAG: polyphosphate kinase [Chitinophagaceae bacterium]|nr:polyphosphate kinase [Chitinophagaceae bacterium]
MNKLASISTRAPQKLSKDIVKKDTIKLQEEINRLQKILYAQKKYSLLIILQGLDASGKDGLVSNVFAGLNPLGIDVAAFKAPSEEEKGHDFLWRIHSHVPSKGNIQIFNRSHYEDVLVPRVEKWIDIAQVKKRYTFINQFESLLMDENNTVILKFYLHISKEEQLDRLNERKINPEKFWKHNDGDEKTREKWDDYIKAYEGIFTNCNNIPWTIVPSDQNWYKEYIVSKTILTALRKLDLRYPKLGK